MDIFLLSALFRGRQGGEEEIMTDRVEMRRTARMCLQTSNIDYNGRLCMVSAAAANKKAFGIDRAANSWSDILKAEVVWISGANIAECAPITTNYVWQAREYGAKDKSSASRNRRSMSRPISLPAG